MIRFDHVTKQYTAGAFTLDDVSFSVSEGEFVFLIGPSGAGKTTILNLLMRNILPDNGSITVENEEISNRKYRKQEELRRMIGAVFQNFKIISELTVLENIVVSLDIMGVRDKKTEAMKALSLVGLAGREFFFPLQLSAGELQRLSIARAIAGGRRIILADEPTGNLDPVTSWELIKLFRAVHNDHRTIVFATHSAEIVNALKKRVITLKNGKIIKDKLKSSYDLDI